MLDKIEIEKMYRYALVTDKDLSGWIPYDDELANEYGIINTFYDSRSIKDSHGYDNKLIREHLSVDELRDIVGSYFNLKSIDLLKGGVKHPFCNNSEYKRIKDDPRYKDSPLISDIEEIMYALAKYKINVCKKFYNNKHKLRSMLNDVSIAIERSIKKKTRKTVIVSTVPVFIEDNNYVYLISLASKVVDVKNKHLTAII